MVNFLNNYAGEIMISVAYLLLMGIFYCNFNRPGVTWAKNKS
jgi:hypothetical protein